MVTAWRQEVAERKQVMLSTIESGTGSRHALSPMTLSDRLITLAKDAESLGYAVTADQLVQLAFTVFDEAPPPSHH
jgi:hypothetical protein